MQRLIQQLAWKETDFDYIGSSDDLSAGRPNPIMIFEAMKKLGLTDTSKILKIGDTRVDVEEGKNAKAVTAMVLTGTQDSSALGGVKPDYIFDSVRDLMEILN